MGFFAEFFAFIGMVVTSIWFIIALTVFIIWLAHCESKGWLLFFIGILGILVYKSSPELPLWVWVTAIVTYIPNGLVWSRFRFKKRCDKIVQRTNEQNAARSEHAIKNYSNFDRERDADRLESALSVQENVGQIITSVLAWPFELVENILGDLIDLLEDLIKTKLLNWYASMSNSARSKLIPIPEAGDTNQPPHKSRVHVIEVDVDEEPFHTKNTQSRYE